MERGGRERPEVEGMKTEPGEAQLVCTAELRQFVNARIRGANTYSFSRFVYGRINRPTST